MKDDNSKSLQTILNRPHITAFKLQKAIGVSVIVINTFVAGMPVKQAQEDKLVAYIEGAI